MNSEDAKIIHIAGELTSYFLRLNSKKIDVSIRILEDNTEITIKARDTVLSREQTEELSIQLSSPRQREVEGYYWNLAGGGHDGEELRLISTMIDVLGITTCEADGTTIKLKR